MSQVFILINTQYVFAFINFSFNKGANDLKFYFCPLYIV